MRAVNDLSTTHYIIQADNLLVAGLFLGTVFAQAEDSTEEAGAAPVKLAAVQGQEQSSGTSGTEAA